MLATLPKDPSAISFADIFGRKAPVEIEIGVGKGRFLKEYALANPQLNLLGIEKSIKWLRIAEERVAKAQIQNVRLVSMYAQEFLENYVADETVRAFHIYFSDPWPKRRHHKRRVFQTDFLKAIHRVLEPNGTIHIATDYEEYFHVTSALFASELRIHFTFSDVERGPYISNFQAKYEREGRKIYFAKAVKIQSSSLPDRKPLEAFRASACQ